MTHASRIAGFGLHVPEKILTNADLERMVETSDEWIVSRTGIRTRHIAAPGEATSDLALGAAKKALADAGWQAAQLTHILVCTLTPDSYVPSSATVLEHKLGIEGKMAMDLNAACSGFTYGLETARAIIALHPEARVLVVGAEVLSHRSNWNDRTTCVLFGDGAGAAVLEACPKGSGKGEILDVAAASDGAIGHLLTVLGGGSGSPYKLGEPVDERYFIHMEGREVFKHAVRRMEGVAREVLGRNGYTIEDVDVCIPHQANIRIIEAVGKKLELPADKVFVNVDRYGNTSAASVPIALAEAHEQGRLPEGALCLLVAFGGGFTWGAALIRF